MRDGKITAVSRWLLLLKRLLFLFLFDDRQFVLFLSLWEVDSELFDLRDGSRVLFDYHLGVSLSSSCEIESLRRESIEAGMLRNREHGRLRMIKRKMMLILLRKRMMVSLVEEERIELPSRRLQIITCTIWQN